MIMAVAVLWGTYTLTLNIEDRVSKNSGPSDDVVRSLELSGVWSQTSGSLVMSLINVYIES